MLTLDSIATLLLTAAAAIREFRVIADEARLVIEAWKALSAEISPFFPFKKI
jgi:hypothetical protein